MSFLNHFLWNPHPSKALDEIVFEKRNRAYGAYQIRRSYRRTMTLSNVGSLLLLFFILFLNQCSHWLEKKSVFEMSNLEQSVYEIPDYKPAGKLQQGSEEDPLQKKEKPKVKLGKKTESTSGSFSVQKDEKPKEEILLHTKDSGTASGKSQEVVGLTGEGTGDEIYAVVSHMPLFPGCEENLIYSIRKKCSEKKLREFLQYNLKYPGAAVKNKTEGTVLIQFIVEKNGTVSNIKILQDIGDGCGIEARRVVELMNNMNSRWSPGLQKGEHAVRVQYTLPVVFSSRR